MVRNAIIKVSYFFYFTALLHTSRNHTVLVNHLCVIESDQVQLGGLPIKTKVCGMTAYS